MRAKAGHYFEKKESLREILARKKAAQVVLPHQDTILGRVEKMQRGMKDKGNCAW